MIGSLTGLAARYGGTVSGDGEVELHAVASIAEATANDLAPLLHSRYLRDLPSCPAAALLTDEALAARVEGRALWVHPSPREALARLLEELPLPSHLVLRASEPLAHPSAVVDPTARLGEGVRLGPLAVVGAGAIVGAGSVLGARAFVEAGARLGVGCEVGPGAMVLAGCRLGDRVRLGPGAVVGGDGFGFVPDAGMGVPRRMPQRGVVVLEDDVEVGALACVDRATLGETRLRKGAKVDNLVQVGHNVEVGEGALVAAQVGLAGSVTVGAGALLGGQAGVADHLEVGPGARLAARSGVTADVEPGATVAGYPALPHGEWLRIWGWIRRAVRTDRRNGA